MCPPFKLRPIKQVRNRSAFTIVELLVVCAVIAILLASALPGLARAKGAARTVKCVSNLRQVGLATLLYVNEYGAYPGGVGAAARWSSLSWVAQIRKYSRATWTNELFRCPDNFVSRRVSGGSSGGLGGPGALLEYVPSERDYDYNESGLGGNGLGWIWRAPGVAQPVREAMVDSPSEMLAFGDSFLPTTAMLPETGSFFSPYAAIDPNRFPERQKAQSRRHSGRFNVFHSDGHLERFPANRLFRFSPEVASRWNRDNKPHPEAWP